MTVRVQEADFDLGAELALLRACDPRVGALASFVGLVRDLNDGASVTEMTLEHYPGMTERHWKKLLPKPKRVGISTAPWSSIASARSNPVTRSCWLP